MLVSTCMISHSLLETEKITQEFLENLEPKKDSATVVGLYGNLGAGKTAFTQCVARVLGISEKVLSPTFVIMKVYELKYEVRSTKYENQNLNSSNFKLRNSNFDHLIHIDAYRMDSSDELLHLGWKEITSNPKNLILIEWPERVLDIMPEHISIKFETLEDQNSRQIDIKVF